MKDAYLVLAHSYSTGQLVRGHIIETLCEYARLCLWVIRVRQQRSEVQMNEKLLVVVRSQGIMFKGPDKYHETETHPAQNNSLHYD